MQGVIPGHEASEVECENNSSGFSCINYVFNKKIRNLSIRKFKFSPKEFRTIFCHILAVMFQCPVSVNCEVSNPYVI
jgi:hypothetical protein